jgi:hypothetical protein
MRKTKGSPLFLSGEIELTQERDLNPMIFYEGEGGQMQNVNRTTLGSLASRLDGHFGRCAALAAAGVGGGMITATQTADAAIVWSGPVSINIPSTTAGIYLNVVTGVSGTAAGTPGWDVNPWGSGSLNHFSPTPNPGGGPMVGNGAANYNNLAPNTPIGAGSTFTATGTTTINAATPHNLNSSDNLHGFRFINETQGNCISFGWLRISLGATAQAQPRAIVEYAYDNTCGAEIGAGVTPEPGSLALLAMGAAGVLIRRRK